MTLTNMVGCIKKGLLSELPTHAAYLNDYLFYATDTGDLYWDNGTAWTLLQGPLKAEEIKSKTIDTTYNTLLNVVLDPFISRRREGFINPSLTVDGSVKGAMKGLPSNGTYSYNYESSTEGYFSRFSTSAISNIGYASTGSTSLITKRRLNPKLKIRCRPSATAAAKLYIGFTTNVLPSSDVPIGTADSGVIVGFNSLNANFVVIRNNATGTATITTFTVTKDVIWRTFEIIMTNTNVTIKVDNINSLVYTTFLPGLDTYMNVNIQYQSTDTTAKTFDIVKGSFSSDI